MDWLEEKLDELRKLEKGWDSYNGQRINEICLQLADLIVSCVMEDGMAKPFIVPCSDGGVGIEWHRNAHDLEIYITPGERTEWILTDKAGNIISENGDAKSLRDAVRLVAS